jgi:protein SCO1/2
MTSSAAAPEQNAGEGLQRRVAWLAGKPWFWAAWVFGLAAVMIIGAVRKNVPKPPAMKLPLPAFELTSQKGERFGLKDLKGQVWVADFVFTSCPTVCPKLTTRMAQLQRRSRHLGDAFHLVTFTVDPENDTPERLAQYAATYHVNPRRWTFLTGSLQDIEATVVKGFKLAMGKEEASPGSGLFSIFHGEKLVLVDADGMIRGYYDADDPGIKELLRNVDILVNTR